MAVRDRFEDIRHHINCDNPVVVDGGAYIGHTINIFLKMYAKPLIFAFEPVPQLADALKTNHPSPDVHIYENALGAVNQQIQFHVLKALQSSSILPPGDWVRKYHEEKMDIRQTIEVEMVRLDSILPVKSIDIFKLDLQGYELEALKGAEHLLPHIKVITTEVEFVPLYLNQPLFSDIESFLRAHDFRLLNLYELWTHPDGQLTAGDAVFLNNHFFGMDLPG